MFCRRVSSPYIQKSMEEYRINLRLRISVCVIGDPLGRKNCVLLGTTIMSIGAIIQVASFNIPEMIVGRIVAGIGNGINTSTGDYNHGPFLVGFGLTEQPLSGKARHRKRAGEAN